MELLKPLKRTAPYQRCAILRNTDKNDFCQIVNFSFLILHYLHIIMSFDVINLSTNTNNSI